MQQNYILSYTQTPQTTYQKMQIEQNTQEPRIPIKIEPLTGPIDQRVQDFDPSKQDKQCSIM
jgi:hypothetical protein